MWCKRCWTPAVLALGAVLVLGCESSTVEPVDTVEEYDLLWDLQSGDWMEAQAQAQNTPVLARLFRQALQQIARDEGREAARAVRAGVEAIRAEARALYEAEDREGARAKMEEARRAMAQVVIDVLGTEPVDRLLAWVAQGQARIAATIEQREAAGEDPVVLKRLHAHLTGLTDAADAALAAGDAAAALDYASRAVEVLVRFRARHGQG
jgi:hypothetical protein